MRIELSHVHKRYGAAAALAGVTLSIPSGRRVALVGPNGSGKSTLIRALLGLIACEGEVRIDGRDPLTEREALSRRMAYVPQVAPQLAAPVAELVQAIAALRRIDPVRIAETARALDLHLAEIAARPFRHLSGGMKQKLLIALALSSDAELLVLDEPTASLDGDARARFFRLFGERAASATLILCSHRLDDVRHLVDHVVQLGDGRVEKERPLAAFLDEIEHTPDPALRDLHARASEPRHADKKDHLN